MKFLVYSDSPTAPTGFGTVVRNVFGSLIDRSFCTYDDVSFFAINYGGDHHGTPFKIWPAQVAMRRDPDLYGKQRFLEMVMAGVWDFDVLFVLLDHFSLVQPVSVNNQQVPFLPTVIQLARNAGRKFKTVQYLPIDVDNCRPEWVAWMPGMIDALVAYTEFGKRVVSDVVPALYDRMTVIPHGTNPELYHPVPAGDREAFRRQTFGLGPDDPLIINVNRNQPRKDLPRTLQVFQRVLREFPNATLYCHMNVVDPAGFNLQQLLQHLHIPQGRVRFPANFSEGIGVPVAQLNLIYNAADLYLTTARGEGWGLSLTDAMTVGLPCVAPDHTSFHEILANGRGVLVSPLSVRDCMTWDNDQLRPVADVEAMARDVCVLLSNADARNRIGRAAREWARRLSWRDAIAPQWEALFRVVVEGPKPVAQMQRRFQLNAVEATA